MYLKRKISKSSWDVMLMFFVFFTALITPRDTLGLKKISLLIAIIYYFPEIVKGYKKNVKLFLISMLFPFFLYLISVIHIEKIFEPLTFVYFWAYIPLLFPVLHRNIDIKKIFLYVIDIMTWIIFFSALLDMTGIIKISQNQLLQWMNMNGEAQISCSPYAIGYYVLFLKASPVLLYGLMVSLERKKYIKSLIQFLAVVFTGTRANIYLAILMAAFYFIYMEENKVAKIIMFAVSVTLCVVYGRNIINKIATINWAKSEGDNIRMQNIISIFNAMKEDPINFFIGMGFASKYYSLGRKAYIADSELSYLEMIREIGLVFGSIMLIFLIYPIKSLYKKYTTECILWMCYLMEGVLEPFIFTSTGYIVIMYILCFVIKEVKNENFVCYNSFRRIY